MAESQNNIKHSLIILIVCFFAFFVNNTFIPADLMEARNLATAQEMVSQGNYLTPTLNGELRLEKPPLPTWIAAGIEHIFPDNLSAQRYATGLTATLLIFFLYLLIIELTERKKLALIAALVLASCYNVVMMGRTATWDIYCHSFMLGSIYFLVKALNRNGNQRYNFLISGLFMGLSFLSKGPVSFFALLLPFLISYFIIYRPSLKGKIFSVCLMVIFCLVISLWWPFYIYLFYKESGLDIANKESSSWIYHNVRPCYYYWQFAGEAGIWALLWVSSLFWPYWKLRFSEIHIKKSYLFSIMWSFTSLILLSVVPEKKTRYLLPLLIPGAINTAFCLFYFITTRNRNPKEDVILKTNIIIILAILLVLPIALHFFFFKEGYLSLWLAAIISIISLSLAGVLYYYTFRSNNIMNSFYCIVSVMILVEALCFIPASNMLINSERYSIKEIKKISEINNLPFYYIEGEELRIEFVYESNKIIRPLNVDNDSIILSNLPFVLLSSSSPDSIFLHLNVNIELIGIYDNNWKKRKSKRYNENLVRYVTLIKEEN